MSLTDSLSRKLIEHWHRPFVGALGALIVTGSIFVPLHSSGRHTSNLQLAVCLTTPIIFLTVWWIARRPPRTPRGKVGILLAIRAESDADAHRLRHDFIDHLKNTIRRGDSTKDFYLGELPLFIAANLETEEDKTTLLAKSRASLLITGISKRRKLDGGESHVLDLEGLMVHAAVTATAHHQLSTDFSTALPRRTIVPDDHSVFAFEAASQHVGLGVMLVIGIAHLFAGKLSTAERLFLDVEKSLNTSPTDSIAARLLSGPSEEWLRRLYDRWIGALHSEYARNRNNALIPTIENKADKLLARQPKSPVANTSKALCRFLLDRDTNLARSHLERLGRSGGVSRVLNLAFLDAYEGDLRSANEHYKTLFRELDPKMATLIEAEEFIQLILEQEPERHELHFCLGVINYKAKNDLAVATGAFRAFLCERAPGKNRAEYAIAEELLARCEASIERDASS